MDNHGLKIGDRIIYQDCYPDCRGEIMEINNGMAFVLWDNGRYRDVSIDEIIPEEGW